MRTRLVLIVDHRFEPGDVIRWCAGGHNEDVYIVHKVDFIHDNDDGVSPCYHFTNTDQVINVAYADLLMEIVE